MSDFRRQHEDIQCADVKILKDWREVHVTEHRALWERMERMEIASREVRDTVIALKTQMMVFTSLASLLGAVLGQLIMLLVKHI